MFAIAGGKGGCGKTTTALGLGHALARAGAEPLVIDADVDMPDLHLLTDVPPEPDATDLAGGAHAGCVRHRPPDGPGVSVVPAGTAEATPGALRRASEWHGPVLVDCPAGASADATVPLRRCDGTVLVTTDTPQSLSDTHKTALVADRLDAPVVGALLRVTDARAVALPFECPHVERVGTITDGDPLEHPATRAAHRALAEQIRAWGTRRDGGLPREMPSIAGKWQSKSETITKAECLMGDRE